MDEHELDVDDVAQLPELTDDSLNRALQIRYKRDVIYVSHQSGDGDWIEGD